MTQKQAAYFEKAYETRNIAVAAEAMFVSRSVISRAIQDMEEEFGTPLFERSKQGISPTEAGHLVHGLILQFYGGYNTLIHRFRNMEQGSSHRLLRIAVTPTNSRTITQLLFGPFLEQFPDVTVHVTELNHDSILASLAAGSADMVVNPGSEAQLSGYESLPLYQVRLVLAVSRNDPLSQKKLITALDLAEPPLGFLSVPLSRVERVIINACAAVSREPNVAIRTGDLLLLQELTERGLICSVLPDDMIRSWRNVAGVPLETPRAPSTHYLVWNRNGALCSAGKDFLGFIRDHFSN